MVLTPQVGHWSSAGTAYEELARQRTANWAESPWFTPIDELLHEYEAVLLNGTGLSGATADSPE